LLEILRSAVFQESEVRHACFSQTFVRGGRRLLQLRWLVEVKMATGLTEETMFWMRLAAFAGVSEYVLSTGASLQDAEALLFGYCLPGDLPSRYASLGGGAANPRILV